MRAAFIGCVEFSYHALSSLMDIAEVDVVGIVTKTRSGFNSDFRSLKSIGDEARIPVYLQDEQGPAELFDFLSQLKVDVIFCLGWNHILGRDVLGLPEKGVVGFHPSLLPRGRGRHPLIWTMVLGLSETASTFFLMEEGADTGDILSQQRITIPDHWNAGHLYSEVTTIACQQLRCFVPALISNTITAVAQDHRRASTWRRRTADDGLVDWRMGSASIRNLVRALAQPYPGADCLWKGSMAKIWDVKIGPEMPGDLEPGRVLERAGTAILVKTGDGSLWVSGHTLSPIPEEEDYLC